MPRSWVSHALLIVVASLALGVAQRRPLQKTDTKFEWPPPVNRELVGHDKKGKPIYYDPQPRRVPLGNGKYALKWRGSRGQQLSVIYERPDMIDAVVEASVVSGPREALGFHYRVRNLMSSKQQLGGFAVQTFSVDARARRDRDFHVGVMTNLVREFREGRWIRFGLLEMNPGNKADLQLISSDLPGLVACRAHGTTLVMQGPEMPSGLDRLPGYGIWPLGKTIGPDSRLSKFSQDESRKYLADRLPEMLQLGWIADEAVMKWYQDSLKQGQDTQVKSRAQEDFKSNRITSEVLALMTYNLKSQ